VGKYSNPPAEVFISNKKGAAIYYQLGFSQTILKISQGDSNIGVRKKIENKDLQKAPGFSWTNGSEVSILELQKKVCAWSMTNIKIAAAIMVMDQALVLSP